VLISRGSQISASSHDEGFEAILEKIGKIEAAMNPGDEEQDNAA
jgi:hypothetical protein